MEQNFNRMMNDDVDEMTSDELADVVVNLREIVAEGKEQWDKVAAILDVDGDAPGAMFAKARTLMAGIGANEQASAKVAEARAHFSVFASLHEAIDSAMLYELAHQDLRFNKIADMTVDKFIEFKRYRAMHSGDVMESKVAMLGEPEKSKSAMGNFIDTILGRRP